MIRFSDKLQLIGSAYFQQVIRFLTLLVMYRFISPDDRGVYMALVYGAGLIMALNDFAIPQGVVQIRDEPEDVVVDTGLVLNGLLYFVYGLFAVAAGYYLSRHKHNPQYWKIGYIFAITTFLTSLYNVQLARLNRRLEFRAESRQNIILALSTAITGIIFAILHYGPFALAFQVFAGQLAANIAVNLRVPLTWPRQVSWRVVKRFFKLGTPASVATYIRSVEAPIVGLIIFPVSGTFGLGLWSQAQQMQQMFGQNLLTSFQRVAYPMVCQSVTDTQRTKNLTVRITLMLMMISLWFTAVVGVNSESIVRISLSKQWAATAPLLRITAWAIPAGALDMIATILCMALGVTTSFVRSAVWNLVLFIPALLITWHLGGGLLGLAICWSVSRYFIALATLEAVKRKIDLGIRDVFKPLAALFSAMIASCAVMVAVCFALRQIPLPIQFVVSGFAGSVVYFAAVWLLEPDTVRDALNMARGQGTPQSPQPLQAALVANAENPAGEQGTLLAPPDASPEPKPEAPKESESTSMTTADFLRKIIPENCRPIRYLMNQAWNGSNGKVRAGPFKGMAYGQHSFGSCYIPKMLGIYERECYPAVEWACAQKPQLIVDVGAAEGYYAVGLCLRNPQAKVIAFEMEAEGRTLLEESARSNDCNGRVEIRGACEPTGLKEALGETQPALVVCDCEGYENVVLDPDAVPSLRNAMILVELHDVFEPGTADRIKKRFEPTHDIEEIWARPHDTSEYPYSSLYTRLLPRKYLEWTVSEWRPGPMSWFWMRPKEMGARTGASA